MMKKESANRKGTAFRACSMNLNYMQMKTGLGSNKKKCNTKGSGRAACCRCWGRTGQGSRYRVNLASIFAWPMASTPLRPQLPFSLKRRPCCYPWAGTGKESGCNAQPQQQSRMSPLLLAVERIGSMSRLCHGEPQFEVGAKAPGEEGDRNAEGAATVAGRGDCERHARWKRQRPDPAAGSDGRQMRGDRERRAAGSGGLGGAGGWALRQGRVSDAWITLPGHPVFSAAGRPRAPASFCFAELHDVPSPVGAHDLACSPRQPATCSLPPAERIRLPPRRVASV